MSKFEGYDEEAIIKACFFDGNIEGFSKTENGFLLDRRYTPEAIGRMGLNPRTADLNIIGPEVIEIPRDTMQRIVNTALYELIGPLDCREFDIP